MDFLLVFADWLDLGFTGIGLMLGVMVYRRRALLTDTLWWIRQEHRQTALLMVIKALDIAETRDPEQVISELERKWGRLLTEMDRYFAHGVMDGINYRSKSGDDEDEDTTSEMPSAHSRGKLGISRLGSGSLATSLSELAPVAQDVGLFGADCLVAELVPAPADERHVGRFWGYLVVHIMDVGGRPNESTRLFRDSIWWDIALHCDPCLSVAGEMGDAGGH